MGISWTRQSPAPAVSRNIENNVYGRALVEKLCMISTCQTRGHAADPARKGYCTAGARCVERGMVPIGYIRRD